MARSVLVLVFGLVVFSACDSAELMDSDNAQSLRQFALGDMWIMSRTDSLHYGSVRQQVDTLSVSDSRVIGGETWYLIDSSGDNPLRDESAGMPWVTVRENGVWVRRILEDSIPPEQLFLPLSLPDGEEVQRDSGLRITRIPAKETITLGGGESFESIGFVLTATDEYRPLYNATGDLERYQTYPVEGEVTFVDKFSRTHGFVRISGIWITSKADTERFQRVGDYHLDLIQFIPGD